MLRTLGMRHRQYNQLKNERPCAQSRLCHIEIENQAYCMGLTRIVPERQSRPSLCCFETNGSSIRLILIPVPEIINKSGLYLDVLANIHRENEPPIIKLK
jgi:hypothetical protein